MTGMGMHARNYRQPGTGTSGTGTRNRNYPWPLLLIAAPAVVAVWSGWVGLGSKCGFGPVDLLPGIGSGFRLNTAITLPVGIECYGAYALSAWLTLKVASERTRDFAKKSAIGALLLGCLGQVAYHLLTAAHQAQAPWPVTMLVSCLPVVTLYFGAALSHLIVADVRDARTARVAAEQTAAEAERVRAERAAAKAEAKLAGTGTGTGTGTRKRNPERAPRKRNPEPEVLAPEPESAAEPATEEAVDVDGEARILQLLAEGKIGTEDGILKLVAIGRTPSKAGQLAGRSDSYGRAVARKARELAEAAPKGQDPQE